MSGNRKLGKRSDQRKAMLRAMVTYLLENGQINGLGTHAELLATNAIYQEVYNSQTQGGGDFDEAAMKGGD